MYIIHDFHFKKISGLKQGKSDNESIKIHILYNTHTYIHVLYINLPSI